MVQQGPSSSWTAPGLLGISVLSRPRAGATSCQYDQPRFMKMFHRSSAPVDLYCFILVCFAKCLQRALLIVSWNSFYLPTDLSSSSMNFTC